ncbi:MAG: hypothetical protein K5637_02685 [Lachnospiraceae bacterium]|nr:hypothetical protein [Lachnospiraceae bacterium]
MDNAQEIFNQRINASLIENKRVKLGIVNRFEKAVNDCGMVSDNDRVLIPIGNNADSVLLALLFRRLKGTGGIDFEPVFVSENDIKVRPDSRFTADYAAFLGVPAPEEAGIPAIVAAARNRGCNKAALCDHYSDRVVTAPKETVPGEPALQLIRPMRLVRKEDIEFWNSFTGLNLPLAD